MKEASSFLPSFLSFTLLQSLYRDVGVEEKGREGKGREGKGREEKKGGRDHFVFLKEPSDLTVLERERGRGKTKRERETEW